MPEEGKGVPMRVDRSGRARWLTTLALVGGVALTMLSPPVEAGGLPWTVVAKHLDNPHGVAFTADGRMIITEAGHSGKTCVFNGAACFGFNGKVSSIDPATGEHTTLAGGLLSAVYPFETFGLGGVSTGNGSIQAIMGLNPRFLGKPSDACGPGGGEECRDAVREAKRQSGRLLEIDPATGDLTTVASVGAYNYDWVVDQNPSPGNPDFSPGDADPYGLLATPDGTYIADGGSNTIGMVDPNAGVSVLAYIPDPPNHEPLYDAVGTCVAKVGGTVYVGTLIGSLYKWENGALSEVPLDGKLRHIVGCTSDAAGNLYIVNLTQKFNDFNPKPGSGSIVRVAPDLTTSYVVAPKDHFNYPNGITFGPDGDLYVTINSICPANPERAYAVGIPESYCPHGGQVVRITL
jgi:hypothetical protein